VLSFLRAPTIWFRLSLYADELIIFVMPIAQDLCCVRAILDAFAEASGLCTNISKSQFTSIQCSADVIQLMQQHLPCQLFHFPFKYLGIPLSVYKLKRGDLQPLVDVVVDRLPSWMVGMLSRPGHTALVKSMLSAILVHTSIAVKVCPTVCRDIDKIHRAFIWCGTSTTSGGRFMVAWPKITQPIELEGLGVLDLTTLGHALRL
jgi:hypothetical protein